MRAKLFMLSNFKSFDDVKDSAALLIEVKDILYKYKGHRKSYLVLNDAKIKLYTYIQGGYEINTTHHNTFVALVEVVWYHRGTLCNDIVLTQIEADKMSGTEFDLTKAAPDRRFIVKSSAQDKDIAIALLKFSNRIRYVLILDNIDNQFSQEIDQYPTNVLSILTTLD